MEISGLVDVLGRVTGGRGPRYRRLADAVLIAIDRGDLRAGMRLPAERALAQALAISRSTVVAAYDFLEAHSAIERRRGSGTRVSARARTTDADARVATLARNPSFARLLEGERAIVDFTIGAPAGTDVVLPSDLNVDAADLHALLEEPGYAPLGLRALREAVAARFRARGVATTPEQIVVTSGAQQAIALTAALYVRTTDAVLLENPTYFGAIDAYTAAGARLVPISARVTEQIGAIAPRLVYVIPTFQNPTGAVMPDHRRRELARIAAATQIPIVEDETLADLALDASPPAPIAAHAHDGIVITIGSLSKVLWAGLRIGWMRAPEHVAAKLGRMKAISDLGTTLVTQALATRLLGRLDAIRDRRRAALLPQRDALTSALHASLPSWTWTQPHGGFFLWVRLPSGNAHAFAQVALRHGVAVTPGTNMSVDGSHDDAIRLSYMIDERTIRSGVAQLAQAWEAYTR